MQFSFGDFTVIARVEGGKDCNVFGNQNELFQNFSRRQRGRIAYVYRGVVCEALLSSSSQCDTGEVPEFRFRIFI